MSKDEENTNIDTPSEDEAIKTSVEKTEAANTSESESERPLDIDKNAKKGEFATKRGEVVIREHTFDGIQEYDQRLPNWWLMVLWASIAVFVGYYALYYSFGLLPTSTEVMDKREKEIYAQRKAAMQRTLDNLNDEALMEKWAKDPEIIEKGKAVYTQNCVGCHAADYKSNGGVTARSLVDGEWEYGDKPMDVFNIILKGTPPESKGLNGVMRMPPWPHLGAEKIAQVTAFLIDLNKDDFKDYNK